MTNRSGFDDFKSTLSRLREVTTWVTSSAIVLPLLAYQFDLVPPWPAGKGIVILTAIIQTVVVVISFQIAQRASRRAIGILMYWLLGVFVIVGVAYLISLSELTFLGGPAKERLVKGFVCSEAAARIYAGQCPLLNDELIGEAESVAQLWTEGSVTVSRILLDLLWFACAAAFAMLIAIFVVFQSQQRGKFINVGKKERADK
jgi:hypothetical protein